MCCEGGSMPYKDKYLLIAQILAIVGFFTTGGSLLGFIAAIIVCCTFCTKVSKGGLVTAAVLAFLAGASAIGTGVFLTALPNIIPDGDMVYSNSTDDIVLANRTVEEAVEEYDEIIDAFASIAKRISILAYISSANWIACGVSLLVFINNMTAALEGKPSGTAIPHATAYPTNEAAYPTNDSAYPAKPYQTDV